MQVAVDLCAGLDLNLLEKEGYKQPTYVSENYTIDTVKKVNKGNVVEDLSRLGGKTIGNKRVINSYGNSGADLWGRPTGLWPGSHDESGSDA